MWVPVVACFREDTLANVPVIARPDATEAGRISISGMGTGAGVIYNLRLEF